MIDILKYQ